MRSCDERRTKPHRSRCVHLYPDLSVVSRMHRILAAAGAARVAWVAGAAARAARVARAATMATEVARAEFQQPQKARNA